MVNEEYFVAKNVATKVDILFSFRAWSIQLTHNQRMSINLILAKRGGANGGREKTVVDLCTLSPSQTFLDTVSRFISRVVLFIFSMLFVLAHLFSRLDRAIWLFGCPIVYRTDYKMRIECI